ncbi:MAG: lytic transglycosylase domain-containing protein, partial [Campylobacterota bacterium]|nr:lytic transglycosylase domain-containing protein [Campylobacterota bacterium]
FVSNIFADEQISAKWLSKQPKSIAKDFYIWRYLSQNIEPAEALSALEQVRFLNNKIFYRFVDKYNDNNYDEYVKCKKEKTKKLIYKEDYCIQAGLSVYDATQLTKKELSTVKKKVEKEYKRLYKKLDILSSPIPFQKLIQSDNETFFNTFNECGSLYRAKYFDNFFPLSTIERLKKEKKFAQTIKLIVTNFKMVKAQKSLLNISGEKLSFKSVFHLAINALRHNKKDKALDYLSIAYNKAYYQMEKDNITFWQYLITKQEKYLQKLSSSWDVNLYSLYGADMLKQNKENIVFKIPFNSKDKLSFDTSNPFKWIKVLKDSKKMNKTKLSKYNKIFNHQDTLAHLAFVKERYDRYRKSYFITPYEKHIGDLNKKRQALIYAIARQESRFIPTSISSAYAMGTMQIMPFLSKAIAKQLKEPYFIDKQLEPKTNLKYANHHLNFLERRLKHPLFIAYGYNGGIGFTKRILRKGLFKTKSKYEPFLSMELLPYDETKKYGKKVLANYYIYHNHLNQNNKIKLSRLLNSIKSTH